MIKKLSEDLCYPYLCQKMYAFRYSFGSSQHFVWRSSNFTTSDLVWYFLIEFLRTIHCGLLYHASHMNVAYIGLPFVADSSVEEGGVLWGKQSKTFPDYQL